MLSRALRSWDASEATAFCRKPWGELTGKQQQAASMLDYDANAWEAEAPTPDPALEAGKAAEAELPPQTRGGAAEAEDDRGLVRTVTESVRAFGTWMAGEGISAANSDAAAPLR
jgi:hypothetical protein